MKKLLIIMFLFGCAKETKYESKNGKNGTSCEVIQTPTGAIINCENGTSATVTNGAPGSNGTNGLNGSNGVDGLNSLVKVSNTDNTLCSNGGNVFSVGQDLDRNNVLDTPEIQSVAVMCNGTPGLNAPPAPFMPVGLVDPCGDKAGVYDEVFLKLSNGTLLASVSDNANGNNTRFSVLTPGSYMTTDGSHCYFSVDANNNLFNEHY